MSWDSVTARFGGAALQRGTDCEYTDFAVVDFRTDGAVCVRCGESGVTLTRDLALAIAEFILRNVEADA
jgi:hypothetical protein